MIRFVLIVLFFLLSLLSIFRAPTNLLWYAEILVTEFPWIFIVIEFCFLLWGIKTQRFQTAGNFLAAVSLLFYLSPILRASVIAKGLKKELATSFNITENKTSPFPLRFFRMISGIGTKPVSYQAMIYTAADVAPLTLDFYPSQISGVKPCVVVVHGGSWAGGNSKQLPELNSLLAKKGYHVASINYRLAPAHTSPAQVKDIRTAISFLRARSVELHIDTGKFVLLGRSAGGQLALAAAYQQYDPGIKGVISFYGPADMVWGAHHPANPWVFNSNKVLRDFLGGTYEQVPQAYNESSPITYVNAQTPPTLLLHGQNDVLVAYEHSVRLQKELQKHHVPHYLLTLPWATHGFDYTLNGPGGQLSTYCTETFLAVVTQP
ncbi:MAG TPA: alpha/beta hydrolase [Flavisolibacter sp.]|nr:alpha/beta hydrolase [Flavisolibacter sp.]